MLCATDTSDRGQQKRKTQTGKTTLSVPFNTEPLREPLLPCTHDWTWGGDHLNTAMHDCFEVETRAPVGSVQIDHRDKLSNKNAEPATSNGNFEQEMMGYIRH